MSSGGENNMHTLLADFFDNSELDAETSYLGAASPDNIFSILEALESSEFDPLTSLAHETSHLDPKEGEAEAEGAKSLVSQKSSSSLSSSAPLEESKTELEAAAAAAAAANDSSPKTKRQKLSTGAAGEEDDGQQKISHITVERNRRKQMNDNLVVLRSLMPSFYVKRVCIVPTY